MTKRSPFSLMVLVVMAMTIVSIQCAAAQMSLCDDPSDLVAGQHTDAGDVTVCNDSEKLYVQFTTVPNWTMTETHLAVEKQLNMIPQTGSGNPKIGHFTYKRTYSPGVEEDVYVIDLSDEEFVEGDEIVIAAHAVVQLTDEFGNLIQQETAWGDGEEFPGRNWATYIQYSVQSSETNDGGGDGDGGGGR